MYVMPKNVTGVSSLVTWTANTIPGFGIFLLIMVFFISFISLKQYTNERAFAFSSFFCAILSILMRMIGLINDRIMFIVFVIAAIGLIWLEY
jgi:hypothetical protein